MTRASARQASQAGAMGSPDDANAATLDAAAAAAAVAGETAAPMDADGSPPGGSDGGGSSEHEDDVMLQVWRLCWTRALESGSQCSCTVLSK